MMRPPAVRSPATEMPNAARNCVPNSTQATRIAATEMAATSAIPERSPGDLPSVTDRKIGMLPIGFMIAKSAAKNLTRSDQSTCGPFPDDANSVKD